MSIKLMTMVWDRFASSGSELLAMLALTDWCNDQGGSLHPSVASLATKIRVSESQARRILHKLIEQGFVTVVGNEGGGAPGMTRRYQIDVKKLSELPEIEPETGCMDATPSTDATGSIHARDGSHGCARRVAPMTPEPPLTTIEPPVSNTPVRAPEPQLPEFIDRETWGAFVEMRKKIKKPMTDHAKDLLIKRLQKMRDAGHDIRQVMENSIVNCWQDVYEPKVPPKQNGVHSPKVAERLRASYDRTADIEQARISNARVGITHKTWEGDF